MNTLRVLSAGDLGNPEIMRPAAIGDALNRTASAYRCIAEMPQGRRREAMRSCVRRPYLFECNRSRWPDGRYYLLDREYEFWLGHTIAHTRDELDRMGFATWGRSPAVQVGFNKGCVPIVDDVLQNHPRPMYLLQLADLLDALAGQPLAAA